jgi:hypothetical protein
MLAPVCNKGLIRTLSQVFDSNESDPDRLVNLD